MGMASRSKSNPRYKNGARRRKLREMIRKQELPCAICGRPIHYDEPSDSAHPLSYVLDERLPVSRYKEFGYKSPTEAALDPFNVQPCHYICNQMKSNKTMNELRQGNHVRQMICLPDGKW